MFMYCLFNYVFFCKRNTIKAAYQNLQLIKCSTYMKLEHLQPFMFILKTTKNLNLMSSNINLRGEKGTSRTSPKNKIKLKIKIKVGKNRKKKLQQRRSTKTKSCLLKKTNKETSLEVPQTLPLFYEQTHVLPIEGADVQPLGRNSDGTCCAA